ncbi:hypothetical protein RIF29_38971 [Crotalaria pallida]|uniref:Uncharacterized protein n=1 Tax=Crotalaria pallida TaxID=3830 RepID=A0AAN9E0D2_CROPI
MKPKFQGGLGIRNLRAMNDACLLKLCWNYRNSGNTLWVQVLNGKYGRELNSRHMLKVTQADSSIWKNVARLWPLVSQQECWKIGDGHLISLWHDNWLPAHGRLSNICHQIPEETIHWKLKDIVDSGGNWDWSALQNILPNPILSALCAIPPPAIDMDPDVPLWPSSANGLFTIASAYALLNGWLDSPGDSKWRKLREIEAPERVRAFVVVV